MKTYTYFSRPPRKPYECNPVSKTQQQFGNEQNINTIMARAKKSGQLNSMGQKNNPGQFGDFTGISSYQDAYNQIIAAQNAFMTLPAQVRKFFENDPAQLLGFIEDPRNYDKCVELGIFSKKEAEPVVIPAASQPPSPVPQPVKP